MGVGRDGELRSMIQPALVGKVVGLVIILGHGTPGTVNSSNKTLSQEHLWYI